MSSLDLALHLGPVRHRALNLEEGFSGPHPRVSVFSKQHVNGFADELAHGHPAPVSSLPEEGHAMGRQPDLKAFRVCTHPCTRITVP